MTDTIEPEHPTLNEIVMKFVAPPLFVAKILTVVVYAAEIAIVNCGCFLPDTVGVARVN